MSCPLHPALWVQNWASVQRHMAIGSNKTGHVFYCAACPLLLATVNNNRRPAAGLLPEELFVMVWKFSVGERSKPQADRFSIWTHLVKSHAVGIDAVCSLTLSWWNMQCDTFQHLWSISRLSQVLMHHIPSEIQTFELSADNKPNGSFPRSVE